MRRSFNILRSTRANYILPTKLRLKLLALPTTATFHTSTVNLAKGDHKFGHDSTSWEKRFGGQMHNFPDWIEKWGRKPFLVVGGIGTCITVASAVLHGPLTPLTIGLALPLIGYWILGIKDMTNREHSIKRNFPVLGNIRYIFETIRPEIRQYFIESDQEAHPFSREQRSTVYQRSKRMDDTLPFGTRKNTYATGYEWANHSIWPTAVPEDKWRITIGGEDCKQPYSASIFNISAMSFGALSPNALLALNSAAKTGGFYHNTGEGGVSDYHLRPGGDIVWNVGTAYFGCRDKDGKFDPEAFKKMATRPNIKMIELKLSQGAKPGHGGLLPASKITPEIAKTRLIPMGKDCHSPGAHTAFKGPKGMIQFIAKLRELSGGKPTGFKLCIGRPEEFAALVQAMIELNIYPDFITVDGGEGGTGAAPGEFSNHIGTPMEAGLSLVNNMLVGAGIRQKIKLIAAGKVYSGFALVKTLALGADVCNAARAMMFALGCIQALKCNTNRCPTGITTNDPELMKGLDVGNKAVRVFNYHSRTVRSAMDIIGAIGVDDPANLRPEHIMKKISPSKVVNFRDLYEGPKEGSLLDGTATGIYSQMWENGKKVLEQHA